MSALRGRAGAPAAQAWIELRSDDPSAVSALGIARTRLAAGNGLSGLRRWRLIEIQGRLPEPGALAARLHASTWFYNPHKESLVLRTLERDPAPLPPGWQALLVLERDGTRREAAERWWRHAFRSKVQVHAGTVWGLGFEPGIDASVAASELLSVTDHLHGLFANPHAEWSAHANDGIPLGWISATRSRAQEVRA
jgi:hypothetical protein